MRGVIIVTVVLAVFSGCENNPVSEYGGTMVNTYKRGQQAGESGNLDAVKKAVQAYHAANDKYPQSIEEIKDMIGSEMDVSKYDYDPQTGTVSIKVR